MQQKCVCAKVFLHSSSPPLLDVTIRFVQSVLCAHAMLISTTLLLLCVSLDATLVGPSHSVDAMMLRDDKECCLY